jgi:hypothetical protein
MTDINRHQQGAPASQGGQFRGHEKTEAVTVLDKPRHPLGVDGYWQNGGQGSGVDIVESPVSDRDRNYSITFDDGGYVTVNPFEFGIEEPGGEANDLDRLFIGMHDTEPDTIQTQFVMAIDSEYFEGVFEGQTDEQMEALEAEVLAAVRKQVGDDTVTMEFSTGGERWDDVGIHFNKNFGPEDPIATREADGRLSVFTSNLMHSLESEEAYIKIRNGYGMAAVFQTMNAHGLKY